MAALNATTIQSAFRKTGIWPLDRDAIPLSAFEPSKTTTTQAAQPLPARLPSILVPTPTPTPIPTPTPSVAAITTALGHNADSDSDTLTQEHAEESDEEEEPMERYHIDVPPPIPGTSSRKDLRAENMMLRDIIMQAGIALEEDYAQMKLMDLENERLRKQLLGKGRRKTQSKRTSGRARHMTAAENLDMLARQDWESSMKDVFKEAGPRFRVLKKHILEYQKQVEKAKKAAEREAKKAATAAVRAQARGRGTGSRGGRRGGRRGQGTTGRGKGRGRGAPVPGGTGATAGSSDLGSERSEITDLSNSHSDSDSESEAEVLVLRSRRQRPVRVIQGRASEYADEEGRDEPLEQVQPRPRPRPRPRLPNRPPEIRDDQEAEVFGSDSSGTRNAVAALKQVLVQPRPRPRPRLPNHPPASESRDDQGLGAEVSDSRGRDAVADEPGTLQGNGGQGLTTCQETGMGLVTGVVEGNLEVQNGGIELPAEVQSGEIETQVGPPRRRNPRRRN